MRGISAALVALLSSTLPISPTASSNAAAVAKSQSLPIAETRESLLQEAKQISSLLNDIRFSDIVPPDLEAEQHAREHLQSTNDDDNDDIDIDLGEEITHKRGMENLEDMLTRMSAGNSSTDTAMKKGRPTMEDVRALSDRLSVLAGVVGLSLPQLS